MANLKMETPCTQEVDSRLGMVEDLFDGWLAMPSMVDFLTDERGAVDFKQSKDLVPTGRVTDGGEEDQSYEMAVALCLLHTYWTRYRPSTEHASRACERRVHTKSRLGCHTCKKRKVKCSETWPSCTNCIKRGST